VPAPLEVEDWSEVRSLSCAHAVRESAWSEMRPPGDRSPLRKTGLRSQNSGVSLGACTPRGRGLERSSCLLNSCHRASRHQPTWTDSLD